MRAVLFDLDGTLIDSGREIYFAVRTLSEEMGWAVPAYAEFKPYLGKVIDRFYREYYGMGEQDTRFAVAEFRKRYSEICLSSELFDGIVPLLSSLKDRGMKTCIVTSKGNTLANRICADRGIARYFDIILGSVDDYITPKDENIMKCLSEIGVSPNDAIYVGDCYSDYTASCKAGVGFIGVDYGYGFLHETERRGVTICPSISELESRICNSV